MIHIYWHHSFIIKMLPCFSILKQTRIMTTIQISTMVNSSKIKFSCTKYINLYFSNHSAVLLVTVLFHTKRQLSCTIKKFPQLSERAWNRFLLNLSKYGNMERWTQSKILFLKLWQERLENLSGQEDKA